MVGCVECGGAVRGRGGREASASLCGRMRGFAARAVFAFAMRRMGSVRAQRGITSVMRRERSRRRRCAHQSHHRDAEAAGQFVGDAEAHGAAGFGAFDRGDRNADVAAPAIVGEVLLAQQAALPQPSQFGAV